MNSSGLVKIQNNYSRLTGVERKIADCILAQPNEVPGMTVDALAAAAGVAASGVTRFCRKLGFQGYSQLKISLAGQSEPHNYLVIPAVAPGDDPGTILDKVFQSSIKTLTDTRQMLDRPAFAETVKILGQASRIEFYGVGTSATIAMDAYYRLMRIGYPAFYATDSNIMRVSAASLAPGQVAVGISHSGKSAETINALRLARANGARTAVITSFQDSPICRHADLVLGIYSDEVRYPIEAVSARIAHIAVLDALCVALALENPERAAACIRTMNRLFGNNRRQP